MKDGIRQVVSPMFPPLSTPFIFNQNTYHYRRPDFLVDQSDRQYIELFHRIRVLDESAVSPGWNKNMKDDTQHTAFVFYCRMKHIVHRWIQNANLIELPGRSLVYLGFDHR